MYAKVLETLEIIKWMGTSRRQKLSDESKRPLSMIAGMRTWRNVWGKSRISLEYPEIDALLKDFINEIEPEFVYTTVTMNKNFKCLPHVDGKNVGKSWIIGLGDYSGGELNIEGVKHDIRGRWLKFNGSEKEHWVEPFEGNRYTLVYFNNFEN